MQALDQCLTCAPSAMKVEGRPFLSSLCPVCPNALCLPTSDPSSLGLPLERHSRVILFHRRIGFLNPGIIWQASSARAPAGPNTSGSPRPWELTQPEHPGLPQAEPDAPSPPLLLLVSPWPHFPSDPPFSLCSWTSPAILRGPEHLSPRVPEAFWRIQVCAWQQA